MSVGFPNEFNSPLSTISENIVALKQHLEHLSAADAIEILESSERSVVRLHTLTQKYWFYLKLIIDTPTPNDRDISLPKLTIEQPESARFVGWQMPTNLICEVEDAKLAVNIDLAEWIFNSPLELKSEVYERWRKDLSSFAVALVE